jgi:hypothetical protein
MRFPPENLAGLEEARLKHSRSIIASEQNCSEGGIRTTLGPHPLHRRRVAEDHNEAFAGVVVSSSRLLYTKVVEGVSQKAVSTVVNKPGPMG